MAPTSESTDNYLKAVFEITAVSERATTMEISRRLKVSAASVTGMLKKLASGNPALVVYRKHHGAELTEAGYGRAVEVIRHHRLIEAFLHHALGYRWDEVHDEAEKLEHFISEDLEDRMAEKLGYPDYDPHGHPIPRRDGSIPHCEDLPLAQASPGARVMVNRVPDDDVELLRTLSGFGVELYQEMEILPGSENDGAARVRRPGHPPFVIAKEIAARVRVTVAPDKKDGG